MTPSGLFIGWAIKNNMSLLPKNLFVTIRLFFLNLLRKPVFVMAICLFAFNLIAKSFMIHSIPPGSVYDEIIYVSEAQAFLKLGSDITGTWHPLKLEPADGMYTELTSIMHLPGFLIFRNDPILASKFAPIILGSLIPVLLSLITYHFHRKVKLATITGIVLTLNPWIFEFLRMSFDSLFSISFYLIGITLLLFLNKWGKLLAFIPFFLGFYQYQGHKVLLVPFVFICVILIALEQLVQTKEKYSKKTLTSPSVLAATSVFIACILLTTNYLIRISSLTTSVRMSEYSIIDKAELSRFVDERRRLSLDSPFVTVFENKLSASIVILFKRFLNSFDLRHLFVEGNANVDTYSVLDYGFLHKADFILILIFFIFLGKVSKEKHRRVEVLLGAFIILVTIAGTIPNVIRVGVSWITFRGAFTIIGLSLMSGMALSWILETFSPTIQIIGVLIYLTLSAPFFHTYFVRYPLTFGKHSAFYERILASYVDRQPHKPAVLITDRSDATFDYLATYNQYYNSDSSEQLLASGKNIKSIAQARNNSITIHTTCPSNWTDMALGSIIAVDLTNEPCPVPEHLLTNSSTIQIQSLVDSGTRFIIYNDDLCQPHIIYEFQALKDYRFNIEKLDDSIFCETYFMNFRPLYDF